MSTYLTASNWFSSQSFTCSPTIHSVLSPHRLGHITPLPKAFQWVPHAIGIKYKDSPLAQETLLYSDLCPLTSSLLPSWSSALLILASFCPQTYWAEGSLSRHPRELGNVLSALCDMIDVRKVALNLTGAWNLKQHWKGYLNKCSCDGAWRAPCRRCASISLDKILIEERDFLLELTQKQGNLRWKRLRCGQENFRTEVSQDGGLWGHKGTHLVKRWLNICDPAGSSL